jgi:hypothetical protein
MRTPDGLPISNVLWLLEAFYGVQRGLCDTSTAAAADEQACCCEFLLLLLLLLLSHCSHVGHD